MILLATCKARAYCGCRDVEVVTLTSAVDGYGHFETMSAHDTISRGVESLLVGPAAWHHIAGHITAPRGIPGRGKRADAKW